MAALTPLQQPLDNLCQGLCSQAYTDCMIMHQQVLTAKLRGRENRRHLFSDEVTASHSSSLKANESQITKF